MFFWQYGFTLLGLFVLISIENFFVWEYCPTAWFLVMLTFALRQPLDILPWDTIFPFWKLFERELACLKESILVRFLYNNGDKACELRLCFLYIFYIMYGIFRSYCLWSFFAVNISLWYRLTKGIWKCILMPKFKFEFWIFD